MTEQDTNGGAGGPGVGGCGDRLLRVGKNYIWIKGGVLHVQGAVLHPLILLTCGKPLHILTTPRGRRLMFIRAADVVAEAPHLADLVRRVAARFECSL
jgi:hypothetical protein